MKAKNVTVYEMEKALEAINRLYFDNNVTFNRFDVNRNGINFTLKVKDSKKPGHRLGYPDYETGKQRRLASACWHVHGQFFDALIAVNPKAEIISTLRGQKVVINSEGGNWQDSNIGSIVRPMYYSEACDC